VKVLDKDLLNPDGTIAFSAGHAITRTEAYRYKTQFKKITEEFCARAIGCKTISIGQANSRKTQLSEAIKGLDQNKVLYSPATISFPTKLITKYKLFTPIFVRKSHILMDHS
jgi:hypothetical protein